MSKREEQIRDYRRNIPDLFHGSYRKTYDKAVEGSLRAAINSKCLDCVCWVQAEVKKCPHLSCSLWTVRPYQTASKISQKPSGDIDKKSK